MDDQRLDVALQELAIAAATPVGAQEAVAATSGLASKEVGVPVRGVLRVNSTRGLMTLHRMRGMPSKEKDAAPLPRKVFNGARFDPEYG